MNIQLRIDRLVIDEALLSGGNRDGLGAAVQAELARLLADGHSVNWQAMSVPSLRTDAIHITPDMGVAEMGVCIAHGLVTSLGSGLSEMRQPAGLTNSERTMR